MIQFFSLLLLTFAVVTTEDTWYNTDNWQGGWFPYSPAAGEDTNPTTTIRKDLYDPEHGIVMGVEDSRCDDGKSHLEVDWDFSPVNHTCFIINRSFFIPRSDVHPIHSKDFIPKTYSAPHKCMSDPINYNVVIPTFGTHRPLWAKYGEYKFLPRQRWVHNLEHGSVVMLYHPCADKNEVNILRKLVEKCLYRHIITPYNLLSAERPLALVTWGHRLEMSKVSPEIVINFIKEHALRGPEQTPKDGQYKLLLEKHAEIVTDLKDRELCKIYNFVE